MNELDKIIEGLKLASDWEYQGTGDTMPKKALTTPEAKAAIQKLIDQRVLAGQKEQVTADFTLMASMLSGTLIDFEKQQLKALQDGLQASEGEVG